MNTPVNPDAPTGENAQSTVLRGWTLWLARGVWLVAVLATVSLQLIGLRPYFHQLATLCIDPVEVCVESAQLTPEQAESLAAAGISPDEYAAFLVIGETAIIAVWMVIGFAIFILRSNDWMAMLVSAFLIVFAGVTFSTNAPEAAATAFPVLSRLVQSLTLLGELLITAFFLLFPNGRLIPRWLWWLIPLRLVIALIDDWPGYQTLPIWLSMVVFSLPIGLLLFAQVYRYRRVSTTRERYQTRWVLTGVVYGIGAFLSGVLVALLTGVWQSMLSNVLWLLMGLFLTLIPLSIAAAMLRSNLWDIDVVIRRTTVYTLLTGFLAVIYFGSIVILQRLLSPFTGESTAAVVLSTLLIAALFLPLRRRIQDAIDRRFYRRKYDAQKTLEQFAVTVRDETDLDALTAELVRVIQETMQPEHISVWLKPVEQGLGIEDKAAL